jgi:hypothetical protein
MTIGASRSRFQALNKDSRANSVTPFTATLDRLLHPIVHWPA